jgi:hypothetical protein
MVDLSEVMESEDEGEYKVIKELFTKKGIEFKTDLSPEQCAEIAKLRAVAKRYHIKAINDFVNNYIMLLVSKTRKGRGEFIDAFKSQREERESRLFNDMQSVLK